MTCDMVMTRMLCACMLEQFCHLCMHSQSSFRKKTYIYFHLYQPVSPASGSICLSPPSTIFQPTPYQCYTVLHFPSVLVKNWSKLFTIKKSKSGQYHFNLIQVFQQSSSLCSLNAPSEINANISSPPMLLPSISDICSIICNSSLYFSSLDHRTRHNIPHLRLGQIMNQQSWINASLMHLFLSNAPF